MQTNRWLLITAAGALVLSAVGCVDRQAQQQAKQTEKIVTDTVKVVTTKPVSIQTLTEELQITGDVTAGVDATIGAKQPGKITAVYVQDGDSVTAGQLIATLDSTQLQAQLRQAQSQVSSASAATNQALSALAQARRNASVTPQKSAAAVRAAEAQVRSARSQFQKAQAGARPEERRQAESNVAAAKSNMETAQKELQRIEILVREGAIAANRLDQQRNAYQSSMTQYQSALEQLNIIQNGARTEDLSTAQEAVRQAEENLKSAKAQQQLDPISQDQIAGARAQLESARSQADGARAQVAMVQEMIRDMQIRAPFAGKVSGRPAQAGTIASGATPIARIVGGQGAYFTGQIPGSVVERVQPGLLVDVKLDGLPGRTFAGRVAAVDPLGATVGRLFNTRVQLFAGSEDLRPGMFARGIVKLRTIQNATVVPADAVVIQGSEKYLFIVDNGVAKRLSVTTGLLKGNDQQVMGVPVGAEVIVQGQDGLREGAKVRVEQSRTAKSEAGPYGSQS